MNYLVYKQKIIQNNVSPIMLLSYSDFNEDEDTLELFYQVNHALHKIRDDPHLYEIWNILFNKNKSLLTQYKKYHFNNKERPLIFLSFTTCKRYDLFKQTINSLLNHWLDLDLVDYWFCVDDNSSAEDRKNMEFNYPGIDYYWKSIHEKGHLKSMNLIWDKLNELKPKYWIHMEDDFLFFDKTNYITRGIKGFSLNVKQVLFNLNYAETIDQYHIQGDIKLNDDYSLHDYKEGTYPYSNQHYWPHYSFRPSIIEVDAILKLGNFASPITFFERNYANKWAVHYKSAFFNRITCLHIGKLTHQRDIPNAYDLNQMGQFSEIVSPIKIINLERRPDRKNKVIELLKPLDINYEFVNAVDGNTLNANDALKQLFGGNDFGNKKGVMGCALSHYFLWQKLIEDPKHEYYIIMEDDFSLTPIFKSNLEKLKPEFVEKEVLLLGYHMFNKNRIANPIYDNYDHPVQIKPLNNDLYIGGFFTYSINKKGASKLLQYIGNHGIKHGIDYLIKIIPDLQCYESQPLLTTSVWNENGQPIDTDIQNKYDPLDFTENYIFLPDVDINNHDMYYNNNLTLEEKFSIASKTPSCIGFNSLGFFKNGITKLVSSIYFKPGDGVYIKEVAYNKFKERESKRKFRIKMLCNWCSSKQLCDEWSNMCEYEYTWKDIEITWENTDIDYYVVINSTNEYHDPKKTFVFHMEPWVHDTSKNWGVKTWGKWIQPECIKLRGRNTPYVNNVFWQLEQNYPFWLYSTIKKSKSISTICSSKYFDEGHIMRIDMLKYFESKGLSIDIYNQNNDHHFKNYKGGVTPYVDKSKGMLPYKYYFMIENNFEQNFITEKLWEPILCESLCFYYGCPNVTDHLDPRAYVLLSPDFETSYQLVQKAISEDWHAQRLPYIKAAKEDLLHRMSFFPTLYTDIQQHIRMKTYDDYFEDTYKRVCFIHSCHVKYIGTSILENIVNQVIKIDVDCIFIVNIGDPIHITHPKIKVIQYSSNVSTFELETINLIKTFSEKQNCEILYLHTKGVTNNAPNIKDWTSMMLYFLVEKSNQCIEHLKEYDAVGCNLSTNTKTPHFSGNFWWSTSSYIKTLPYVHTTTKHDAEWWILRNHTCKYKCVHNSNVNHYKQLYPSTLYANEL